jgi:hypothetical protein
MTSIIEIYGRIASHLRRILETLGVERRPRDVTPSLQSYLHPAYSLEHPTPSQAFVHHDGPIAAPGPAAPRDAVRDFLH